MTVRLLLHDNALLRVSIVSISSQTRSAAFSCQSRFRNMREAFVCAVHTCNAGIIHQDDLFEQDGGSRVQDAVDRPEEGGPGLIVEDDDDAGGWQSRTARELPIHAPLKQTV